MQSKKILVFLGNSNKESYTGQLAEAYVDGAKKAGFEVERLNISDMKFDPILHAGYREIQELEPDLMMFQEKVRSSDHIVFIYPNWWCTMPAILKGLFDRTWLPGFAFNFDKPSRKLIKRLTGKTARVIVVAGTHSPFRTWWKFGDFTNEISHGILGFAGFKVRVSTFGPSERVADTVLKSWIEAVRTLGGKGI